MSIELSQDDKKRLAYSLSDSIDLIDNFLKGDWRIMKQSRNTMESERAALVELAERLCPDEFREHRSEE